MNDSSSIEQELKNGRQVLVNTRGISMRPLLWEGKTQVIVRPPDRPMQIGDLPLVRVRTGLYRLHRTVRMENGTIYTRGDNCMAAEAVSPENVLGFVTEIYRGNKKIPMDGIGYRIYTWLWLHTFPVRLVIYRIRALVLRLAGGVVRRVKKWL